MSTAKVIKLLSDAYSPMSAPHELPALLWPGLVKRWLGEGGEGGADEIERQLQRRGWTPQWRFGMYGQAHYHTTTHELLIVISGSASIQLGGTDERARPRNDESDPECRCIVELCRGDVLLLPAGYSHRSRESREGFMMIGSYPAGAERWDMRFPNIMGCPYDCEKIKVWTGSQKRKGLLDGASPDHIFDHGGRERHRDDVDRHWLL